MKHRSDAGAGPLAGFPATWAAIGCRALTASFLSPASRAADAPRSVTQADHFMINAGLNDAWINPATPRQGFQITVFAESVFLTWFTYDTVRPPEETDAMLGGPGQRWLTAQGGFEGDTATLTIYVATGGLFDKPDPEPSLDPGGDGTIIVEFADCNAGLLTYEITSLELAGEIPIQRIVTDNVALCEELAAKDTRGNPPPEEPLEPAGLEGVTAAHNAVRAEVGVAPLSWDPALAEIAQAWAESCVDEVEPANRIDHNPNRSDDYPGYVGENIYESVLEPDPQRAVDKWAAEQADYDYDTNNCAPGKFCGHYTQVVWAATERVGCGVAQCGEFDFPNVIVCDYSPGGNSGGRPY